MKGKTMKLLNKTVWAITPEMLQTMMTIARQNNKSPEAVASQLGKEMKNTNAVSVRDGVAVIRVTGPLFRYANLFTRICGATSYELFAQDFNKALKDPSVQAILLDVDSPGGEVNGCSEVADMIYKARGTKPIIAYASGYCCSGAYWIASACDKIYATDTAVIGSIGVVSIFEKDDENKTIEIVSSQSPNKRPNVETEEGKAKIQEHVDALADVFINKVALNRDISPKEVIENFGGGDVFVGQKAVSIGLADGLSSFEELVSDLNLMEKSFMNEQKPTFSAEDIKMAERERMSQVFASDLAKGKEETAQMLLAKTDMSASDILAVLGTIPTAQKSTDFEKAMASVPNPNISPSVEEQEETPDMVAARIASYTMEVK
ncbi:MAG: S49 family peptidase [Alphaproteobacteria bacterium]|nr:S49 family peptidase [Alphaproteobacteria bacterium]